MRLPCPISTQRLGFIIKCFVSNLPFLLLVDIILLLLRAFKVCHIIASNSLHAVKIYSSRSNTLTMLLDQEDPRC